jgi:hypothetical protein
MKDTTEFSTTALYFLWKQFGNGKLAIQIPSNSNPMGYDFSLSIIKFPYLCSNIPSSTAYNIYNSN